MADINNVLGDEKDREITIRPFDARWEAVLTIYDLPSDEMYKRGVGRTPSEAAERAQLNLDPAKR